MCILKKTSDFLIPYIITLLVVIVLLYGLNKIELHIFLTKNRCMFFDCFFEIWTTFGGFVPFVLIGLICLYKYSMALYLVSAQLIGSLFAVCLKKIIVAPRPHLYFHLHHLDAILPHIQNMHLYNTNSMPSGHTISAFAFFYGCALITKYKKIRLLCLVAAILVAYSRVYLSQHFVDDVLVGSILGVFCAMSCYPLYKIWDKSLNTQSLLNNPFKQCPVLLGSKNI